MNISSAMPLQVDVEKTLEFILTDLNRMLSMCQECNTFLAKMQCILSSSVKPGWTSMPLIKCFLRQHLSLKYPISVHMFGFNTVKKYGRYFCALIGLNIGQMEGYRWFF